MNSRSLRFLFAVVVAFQSFNLMAQKPGGGGRVGSTTRAARPVTTPSRANVPNALPSHPTSAHAYDESQVEFKSQTILVEVPVVVTDKSGNHVHGLTKDDFQLAESGKDQRIASFEEVVAQTTPMQTRPPLPGEFSNLTMKGEQPRSITVVALDSINTPFLDQTYGRKQLLKYLANNLQPNQTFALVAMTSRGVKLIHGLSADPAQLIDALKKTSGELPALTGIDQDAQADAAAGDINSGLSGFDSFAIGSLDNNLALLDQFVAEDNALIAQFQQQRAIEATMRAFLGIAWSLSGVPGRKSLVWATGGFPFYLDSPSTVPGGYLSELYERTMSALSDSEISVYPVDVRGLVNTSPIVDVTNTGQRNGSAALRQVLNRSWLQNSSIETLRDFAEMTGGRAFYNSNDISGGFKRAADDGSSFYMLGYYLDTKNSKPGWRSLKVKLRHEVARGTEIRARNGFFVTNSAFNPDASRKADLDVAVSSAFESTGIPMTIRWLNVLPDGSKKKVQFGLDMPPNALTLRAQNHFDFDYLAVAYGSKDGKSAGSLGKTLQGNVPDQQMDKVRQKGMGLENQIELAPGDYTVRFVVRDNITGKVGSVSAPLQVN